MVVNIATFIFISYCDIENRSCKTKIINRVSTKQGVS